MEYLWNSSPALKRTDADVAALVYKFQHTLSYSEIISVQTGWADINLVFWTEHFIYCFKTSNLQDYLVAYTI